MKRLIGTAVVIAAIGAGGAFAHTHTFSQATIQFKRAEPTTAGDTHFAGEVSHSEHKCEIAREVHVYKVEPGNDTRLLRTFTGASGNFRGDGPALTPGDEVYALIEAKVMSRPGHVHTCKARQGRTKVYPFP